MSRRVRDTLPKVAHNCCIATNITACIPFCFVGTNKYHCAPQPIANNDIFRGSCTCNTPTQSGYEAAMRLFDEKLASLTGREQVEDALREIFNNQRERIAAALQLPEGVEVVLCPSGSDAEYLPLAIARALQPDTQNGKKIVNIVTQLKEIGAGTNSK